MEIIGIIVQRGLSGKQINRLIRGMACRDTSARKKNSVSAAVDMINMAVEALRVRGVGVQVRMHTQAGGTCIRIHIKNETVQLKEAGKQR